MSGAVFNDLEEAAVAADSLALVLYAAKTGFVRRSDDLSLWCRMNAVAIMRRVAALSQTAGDPEVVVALSSASDDLAAVAQAMRRQAWKHETTLRMAVDAAYDARGHIETAVRSMTVRAATHDAKFRFLLNHGPAVLAMQPEIVSALVLLEELVSLGMEGDEFATAAAVLAAGEAATFLVSHGATPRT